MHNLCIFLFVFVQKSFLTKSFFVVAEIHLTSRIHCILVLFCFSYVFVNYFCKRSLPSIFGCFIHLLVFQALAGWTYRPRHVCLILDEFCRGMVHQKLSIYSLSETPIEATLPRINLYNHFDHFLCCIDLKSSRIQLFTRVFL